MRTLAAVRIDDLSFGMLAYDYVNGYNRREMQLRVQPHDRTEPNSTKLDNYSTRDGLQP